MGIAAMAVIVAFAGFPLPSIALLVVGMATIALWEWGRASSAAQDRDTRTLRTAEAFLRRGEIEPAARIAADLALSAKTARVRNCALTVMAWSEVAHGRPTQAMEALDRIQPPHHLDLYCLAVVEDAVGKPKVALQALELEGSLSCEAAKFLVELHARRGRYDEAARAALQHRNALGASNLRRVAQASIEAWALGPAMVLATALFDETGAPEDAATLLRAMAFQRDFQRLNRTVDDVVRRLLQRGREPEARALLTNLATEPGIPSGVRKDLQHALSLLPIG
jgi:thioredoxin-like negative regulator of GroEL